MVMSTFSVFDRKYPIWKKLVEYTEFNRKVHLFRFRPELAFSGKFGPNI